MKDTFRNQGGVAEDKPRKPRHRDTLISVVSPHGNAHQIGRHLLAAMLDKGWHIDTTGGTMPRQNEE